VSDDGAVSAAAAFQRRVADQRLRLLFSAAPAQLQLQQQQLLISDSNDCAAASANTAFD
jgi:hypothetical protein